MTKNDIEIARENLIQSQFAPFTLIKRGLQIPRNALLFNEQSSAEILTFHHALNGTAISLAASRRAPGVTAVLALTREGLREREFPVAFA